MNRLQTTPVRARRHAMSYAVKLYIYLGVWFVVATVLADQWLHHLSSPFVLTFGVVYAVMMIIVGPLVISAADAVGS